MKNVSNSFKQAIAPSLGMRDTTLRITFDISDVTAESDNKTVTASSICEISDKFQIINKKRDTSKRIATFEKDFFKLDGSFSIPSQIPEENGEQGWWSANLCDSNGVFTIPGQITIVFDNNHSSMGLTVTFDELNNEYAVDFDVIAYDASNNIIGSITVTNNDKTRLVMEGQLYNYRKVGLTIRKWCKPYRRARVLEIDLGVVRTYQDNLIKASLIEEVNLTSGKLPSSELKFTVDNVSKEFNILNPQGFYKFLQQRQQVIADIGVKTGDGYEYARLGYYFLNNWQSDEGSLTATFTARNILDLLDSYDYESLIPRDINLYTLAVEIMNLCGVKSYSIDARLQNINTYGLVKKVNCRTALIMIAIASCANIYVTGDNVLTIKVDDVILGSAPVVGSIDMEHMYSDPQIKLDKIVKSVEVAYFSDLDTKLSHILNNGQIVDGEALKVENTLINSLIAAQNVASWILEQRNYRAIYTANWRQNPALDLLDIVDIENAYETKKAIITKQEYEFQGYLIGKTELRGETNVVT